MKWFYNLKVGVKLIAGFVLVAMIAGVVGVVGYLGLYEVGMVRMSSVQSMFEMGEAQAEVLIGERALINRRMMEDSVRHAQYAYIDAAFQKAADSRAIYEPLS